MKSILIVDTPTDCTDCQLMVDGWCYGIKAEDSDGEYALLNEWVEDAPYYSLKEKGDCPLKSLPQERTKIVTENGKEPSLVTVAYLKGWNDCLEEIWGDTE